MSTKQNSSISTAYIFLKLLERRTLSGKRVVVPRSLESLKRQAQIVLGLPESQPILSFYTESGEVISMIDQVLPSTTILVATQANANLSISLNKNQSQQSKPPSALNDQDDDISYDSDEDINQNQNNENDKKRLKKPTNLLKGPEKFVTTSQVESENELKCYIARETAKDELRSSSYPQNESDNKYSSYANGEESEDEFVYESRDVSRRKKNRSDNKMNTSSNRNKSGDNENDENEEDLLKTDSDDENNEQPPESAEQQKIISSILGPQFTVNKFQDIVKNTFSQLESKTQNFYRHAAQEEELQQQYAFQNLIGNLPQAAFLMDRDQITLYSEIIKRIDTILARHRTITTGCISYNMKTVVVGPRHSGKSTILALLTEQFLTELTVTQTWKRNFVFLFDAKKLAVYFSNYLEFYSAFVDLIFNSVKIQRPGFAPYVESVANYFKGIPNSNSSKNRPIIPKRFATNEDFKGTARSLRQIGLELFKCIQDPTAFMAWHTNVLLMPSLVASAFGFSQIHYIIDNAEYLDSQFSPSYPFVDSTEPVDIVEYFKYAISGSSYILSCENMDDFIEIFGPREDSVDLIRDAVFEDVFGFDENDVYGKDKAFMVKFDGDPRLFRFTIDDCGGCPVFLSFWDEMCREVDDDKEADWNRPIAEYSEQMNTVKSLLEHILQFVFVVDEKTDESEKIIQKPILEIHPIISVA